MCIHKYKKKIKFLCVHAHTHIYTSFFSSYFYNFLLLVTFSDRKSPTNHGCTLNSLKSETGFGSPFLLEAARIKTLNSSRTVTSPFTDKKGSQNRNISTNCVCIQLGIYRTRLSVTMKFQNRHKSVLQMGKKHDLRSVDIISWLSFTTLWFLQFQTLNKNNFSKFRWESANH